MNNLCELHGIVIADPGDLCHQCQRTDSNILSMMRQLLDIQKRLSRIEEAMGIDAQSINKSKALRG